VARAHAGHQIAGEVDRENRRHAEADRAGGLVAHRVEGAADVRHQAKDLRRAVIDEAAVLGQRDAARMALQQHRAEFLLQELDLSAQRRLRHI